MFEQEATRMITDLGWKICLGPFYNVNAAKKDVYIWSIKSVLSKKEMNSRGIKTSKNCPPGSRRTVRFLGTVEDGVLISLRHLTTSERKKVGRAKIPRRKRKVRSPSSPQAMAEMSTQRRRHGE